MLTREKNKITYLHFILSILVILVHSINGTGKFQSFFSIESGIGQFAVPLFFVISGFLFFRNADVIADVTKKINKRIHTVLYPFLIWNIIYYVIHLLIKGGKAFSIIELFDVAFNYTYNPAFWFMYQLILLIAISPIIFYALKNTKTKVIFFILASLLVILDIDIPFINEDAILYYTFGAYASRLYTSNKLFLIEKKYIIPAIFIAIFFFFANRVAYGACEVSMRFIPLFTYTVILVRLSVAILIFYIIDLVCKYDKVPEFMKPSFFLYAVHYMIVKGIIIFMQFIIYGYVEPDYWDIIKNLTFIISPILCVVVCYYLSKLLCKKLPKVYEVLTGYRA